jgi:hypothetical protein
MRELPMLILLFAWMIVITPSAPSTPARQMTPCPADHPDSRELVNRFLTRDGYAEDRSSLGLSGATTASVRVLSDETDGTVCQRFADEIAASGSGPGWAWTAYEIGGYYFVAFRHADANVHLGFVPLYIFTTGFQQVRGITM